MATCSTLLHFTGANNSTTFTNDGEVGYWQQDTITPKPVISTTSPILGTSSGKFSGNGRICSVQEDRYVDTNADFTVQFFFRAPAAACYLFLSSYADMGDPGENGLLLHWYQGAGKLRLVTPGSGGVLSSTTLTSGTVYWVQIIRESGTIRLTIDDAVAAAVACSAYIDMRSLVLGGNGSSWGMTNLYIDEFRLVPDAAVDVTRSVALAGLTSTFPVPAVTGYGSCPPLVEATASGFGEDYQGVPAAECLSLLHFEHQYDVSEFTDAVSARTWGCAPEKMADPYVYHTNPIVGGASLFILCNGGIVSDDDSAGTKKYWLRGNFTLQGFIRTPTTNRIVYRDGSIEIRWWLNPNRFEVSLVYGDTHLYLVTSSALSSGTVYWLQLIRESGTVRLTVDDVVAATCQHFNTLRGYQLQIGGSEDTDFSTDPGMYIDEFRLIKNGVFDVTRAVALAGLSLPNSAIVGGASCDLSLTASGIGVGDSSAVTASSLLHFTGADSGTSFIDESGKTWTPHDNGYSLPVTSTVSPIVGTSSGRFLGGANITTPGHEDFQFPGDFAFQFFARVDSGGSGEVQIDYEVNSIYEEATYDYIRFSTAGRTYPVLSFGWREADIGDGSVLDTSGYELSVTDTHWIQVLRSNGVVYIIVDDTVLASRAITKTIGGVFPVKVSGNYIAVDELRIVKGAAENISKAKALEGLSLFSTLGVVGPARAALPLFAESVGTVGSGASTMLPAVSLLHFEGDDNGTTFVDETGKTWALAQKEWSLSWEYGRTHTSDLAPVGNSFGELDIYNGYSGLLNCVSNDFIFAGDFAIQFFLFTETTSNLHLLQLSGDAPNYCALTWSAAANQFNFTFPDGSGTTTLSTAAISTGAFHWVQIIREGHIVYMTVDDAVVGYRVSTTINTFGTGGVTLTAPCKIDELRIFNGCATNTLRSDALTCLGILGLTPSGKGDGCIDVVAEILGTFYSSNTAYGSGAATLSLSSSASGSVSLPAQSHAYAQIMESSGVGAVVSRGAAYANLVAAAASGGKPIFGSGLATLNLAMSGHGARVAAGAVNQALMQEATGFGKLIDVISGDAQAEALFCYGVGSLPHHVEPQLSFVFSKPMSVEVLTHAL